MFRYRDRELAKQIIRKIADLKVEAMFMHVCGTHQDTLVRYGLQSLLEEVGIEIRQGPGCPVCVTTAREIEEAMTIAKAGITLAVFGDILAVPTPNGSLADLRAEGCDIRVVYSIDEAVKIATTGKEVVFMAIGFETTAPTTASTIFSQPPLNFSILSSHRLIPPALRTILDMGEIRVSGLIQPGHVSAIIGLKQYEDIARLYKIPQVVAGFEPLDLLVGIYMLAKQVKEGTSAVENEYSRVVRPQGNQKALSLISEVFKTVDREWRGFPIISESALELKDKYDDYNARKKYENILANVSTEEFILGCRCGEVLRGLMKSKECPLFGKQCTPKNPLGPCMVSREGSCNITYRYSQQD
ncbi:MAG: hydrogenase formation protein HypD [Methanomassiliicoccales archaeon]